MTLKKNSKSGIPLTKAKDLTVREASAIIKLCQVSGVSQVSFRGLVAYFGDIRPHWSSQPAVSASSPTDSQEEIERKTFEQEEFAVKDQQLAELVITDPAQYEHLMEIGDLEDDRQPEVDGDERPQ